MASSHDPSSASPRTATAGPAARRTPWWRRAPVLALAATLALLALAGLWSAWEIRGGAPRADAQARGMPWQVTPLADGGSEVFGLQLGRSTLAQVGQRFERDLRVALVTAVGGGGEVAAPALEAYVESFQAGGIQGRLVLAFDADPAWASAALGRSPRDEVAGSGGARQHALAEDDRLQAQSLVVSALAFLPAARLDEDVVQARFGAPAERVTGPQGERQLLYPALGLAVVLPPADGELARSRTVLQYVAPRDFERRLRAPLRAAAPQQATASMPGR